MRARPGGRRGLSRTGAAVVPGAVVLAVLALALGGCGEQSRLPPDASVGPSPQLPPPQRTLLPTVNVVRGTGWPSGRMPVPAPGLEVQAFASGLDHPRWVSVLPNGDVLVAETNAPERPEEGTGLKGWVMKQVMRHVGSAVPSADRITLLRDADGDGKPELRSVFARGLRSPFGMALVGNRLVVAETDGLREFDYTPGQTQLQGEGRVIAALPAGPRNHHWTKNVIASPDGRFLYASVGSNSNVAEFGLAEEEGRAAIWQIDRTTGAKRPYATGLRNPNGMAFTPDGRLWTVVNERDELGSDLVPDYLTSVREGAFYGWPWSYWGSHVDTRVEPPRPDRVAAAVAPDYALGTHVAPLGLAAAADSPLVAMLRGPLAPGGDARAVRGMFVGEHGSWNRKPRSGYRVVFVPFDGNRPSGAPVDVLSGFVGDDSAWGRPAGVALDARGALFVADDVGNTVWRVTAR